MKYCAGRSGKRKPKLHGGCVFSSTLNYTIYLFFYFQFCLFSFSFSFILNFQVRISHNKFSIFCFYAAYNL